MPTRKSFIAKANNKAALQRYLAETWCKHPEIVPRDVQLILGGFSSEYIIIQGNGSQGLPDVSCESHEEADTCIFAHLEYCVETTATHMLWYKPRTLTFW